MDASHYQIPSLTVIDNFLPDPAGVRRGVIESGFKDFVFKDTVFQNTNIDYKPVGMVDCLSAIFDRAIELHQSGFRLGTVGTRMNSFVHVDDGHSSFAGVLYLNENPIGGTAFWQHKRFGIDRQPTQEQLNELGVTEMEMRQQWDVKDEWEMKTLAGAKFNRFIFYPTNLFHNRWPLEGFGSNSDDGRLVWVCFFDVL